MSTVTSTDLADLNIGSQDYEMTLRLEIDLEASGPYARPVQEWVIETGRSQGAWRLIVRETEDGPAVVSLREQSGGPDPLELVRRLLGQAA
jgi:hypothetical protein